MAVSVEFNGICCILSDLNSEMGCAYKEILRPLFFPGWVS